MKPPLITALILLILACNNNNTLEKVPLQKQMSDTVLNKAQLISHVRLAINPQFKDWVLFSNGTYIILPDSLQANAKENAVKIMKEFGPVSAGNPAGDFSIITLHNTPGWVVGAHYYGMYTYVHPAEMKSQGIVDPSDINIGLYGRRKRDKDSKDLNIILINR